MLILCFHSVSSSSFFLCYGFFERRFLQLSILFSPYLIANRRKSKKVLLDSSSEDNWACSAVNHFFEKGDLYFFLDIPVLSLVCGFVPCLHLLFIFFSFWFGEGCFCSVLLQLGVPNFSVCAPSLPSWAPPNSFGAGGVLYPVSWCENYLSVSGDFNRFHRASFSALFLRLTLDFVSWLLPTPHLRSLKGWRLSSA